MTRGKGRHLRQDGRNEIEGGLRAGESVASIARGLGVSWDCVAREIRRRRVRESRRYAQAGPRNTCLHSETCEVRDLCGLGCAQRCASCASASCNPMCERFQERPDCPRTQRAPYVCNGCRARFTVGCGWPQWFYDARDAGEAARLEATSSRSGIDCTEEQLREMVAVVRPLLRKGQSLERIWQTHAGEFPVSSRTFYRYVNLGVLQICNLELPRKVRYKPRRRRPVDAPPPFRPSLLGRTCADFLALPSEEQASAVEMDCVVSARGCPKTILTLYFRRSCFQLMVLMSRHTQQAVREALDRVELACGAGGFARCMGTLLTDRGSEFLDWAGIESSVVEGERRCSVYYCDPLRSQQKARCERAHVELRKVLPKGSSLASLDDGALGLVCSHVNSYGRPALGGAAPIELASSLLPAGLLEEFGVKRVEPAEVTLRSSLLREAGLA
ncbi:MAG: IS30 family transposase [Coriobacteriia bacterium]|nr:IS30 family transposase [Coriobacteriia bacterium]MBS5478806.1 IS30 family transposase [Coriobacteriia bacterium]